MDDIMNHKHLLALCVLSLVAALAAPAQAADHRDAPSLLTDPAGDINDVYAFRSAEASVDRSVFAMTVFPIADANSLFSDAVEYRFNIVDRTDGTNHAIVCTADAPVAPALQQITCTKDGGAFQTVDLNEVVTCDPGATNICVFAGLRDDPFFFDLADFLSVLNSCLAGTCDATQLVDGDGTDFFLGLNTLSIVIEISNSQFGASTDLAVWGSTVRMGAN